MSAIRFYLDEDCQAEALAHALRQSGMWLETTNELSVRASEDEAQLPLASERGCTITSTNTSDLAALHLQWLKKGWDRAGIFVFSQRPYSVGEIARRSLRLRPAVSGAEKRSRIEWLAT